MSHTRRKRFREQSIGGIVLDFIATLWRQPAEPTAPVPLIAVEAPIIPVSSPAVAISTASTPLTATGTVRRRRRTRSRLLLVVSTAVLIVVVAAIVVLINFFDTSSGSTPLRNDGSIGLNASPSAIVPRTVKPLVAPSGSRLIPDRIFGGAGRITLRQPQEAVRGIGGLTYIADTADHRVLVLGAKGQVIRSINRGNNAPLQAPYSLAMTTSGDLLVLDSDAGQVLQFDPKGVVIHASQRNVVDLTHARGMALDPGGDVLVANTAGNEIVTLDSDLSLISRQAASKTPNSPHLFDQPSAVAVGNDGSIYVVDSQNSRLEQFSSDWQLGQVWPIVASDTLHSPRVLPLQNGGVLMTDPVDDKLLLYSPNNDLPQAFDLPALAGHLTPLGLSAADLPEVLVTCNTSGQVFQVRVPSI